jgi:hypothetical protein
MLAPAIHLMNEFKPLLVKLHEEATIRSYLLVGAMVDW